MAAQITSQVNPRVRPARPSKAIHEERMNPKAVAVLETTAWETEL